MDQPCPRRHKSPPARRVTLANDWEVELLPCAPYEARFQAAMPVIGFAFDSQAGVHAFGSDRRRDFHTRPNGLAFVPRGCDVYSRSPCGGEYLRVLLPAAGSQLWHQARRFSDAIDPVAIEAAHALRRALLAKPAADFRRFETLVQILERRVIRLTSGKGGPTAAERWMTPTRWRRIDRLIDARLDTKIAVQDLASALGLSSGFFSRAFKSAAGQAPHDHVIERRVARARILLRDQAVGLSAIAQECGFASHAHMSATFRRRLGVTPQQLRLQGG